MLDYNYSERERAQGRRREGGGREEGGGGSGEGGSEGEREKMIVVIVGVLMWLRYWSHSSISPV